MSLYIDDELSSLFRQCFRLYTFYFATITNKSSEVFKVDFPELLFQRATVNQVWAFHEKAS